MSPFSSESVRPQRPPCSSISLETPVSHQQEESASESETGSKCERSFVTTVDVGGAILLSGMDRVVASETGATANLVCFSWLTHHNRILAKHGSPKVAAKVMGALGRTPWGGTPCG